jgi:ABC-2 type transport system permease protein
MAWMTFITVISLKKMAMVSLVRNVQQKTNRLMVKSRDYRKSIAWFKGDKAREKVLHPFWVIVNKEISDHLKSWRFIILIFIIALTCLGSLYTALTNMSDAIKPGDPEGSFLFLRLFTISDGTLPSFFVFISFLGPLLGISLGFDSISSEENKGTLSRIMAQPVYRDYLLNAKFIAALIVISVMFFALGFLVMGIGLISTGIPPTAQEFWRIIFFILLSIVYVAFWLNLSILFSVRFRQTSTSLLFGIGIWLFFTVFYNIIVNVIAKAAQPSGMASARQIQQYQEMMLNLVRILPSQLFSDATTTLLMPSVRSLGPLTMEQVYGTIPSPLPLGQSLLLVWPQLTGLITATVVCFALSYASFMREEIRSR